MTFSIIGIDKHNKEIGIATFSKFLACGSIVPMIDIDKGAIASQAYASIKARDYAFSLLKTTPTKDILTQVLQNDIHIDKRQIMIMDSNGETSVFTGDDMNSWFGSMKGDSCIAAGNQLKSGNVLKAMIRSFETTKAPLHMKLLICLKEAQKFGGDIGENSFSSACLMISKKDCGFLGENNDYMNLRVDCHRSPIGQLEKMIKIRLEQYGHAYRKQ